MKSNEELQEIITKCPKCHGVGTLLLKQEYNIIRRDGAIEKLPLNAMDCICRRNYNIACSYKQLRFLPPITDLEVFKTKILMDINKKKFVVFRGGSRYKFYWFVKQFLLQHRTYYEKKLIISSNEFVEQFFLPTDNHEDERRVSENDYYNHIFLTLDSGIIRPSTKSVIGDLLNDRVLLGLPIWVHTHHPTINQSAEYSDAMTDPLEVFKSFSIGTAKLPYYKEPGT